MTDSLKPQLQAELDHDVRNGNLTEGGAEFIQDVLDNGLGEVTSEDKEWALKHWGER